MERIVESIPSLPPDREADREENRQVARPDFLDDPFDASLPEKQISRRQLINKLNSLNFQDRALSVVFQHREYPRTLTLQAYPLPCQGARLVCRWDKEIDFDVLAESYRFQCLHVSKGQQLIKVQAQVNAINERQIILTLPETCIEISTRKIHRHQCRQVAAYLFQNGATYYGSLLDYGAAQFRVSVTTTPPQTFGWIEVDLPVTIVFTKNNRTLYSGECRIVRHDGGVDTRHFTLEPMQRQMRRFQCREFRSTRHQLTPPPDVSFEHPLFGKTIDLKVHDISGSGFSVEEDASSTVLLPGLIIPDMNLIFSDGSTLHCIAQVVYCLAQNGARHPVVLSGLTILDMAVEDHIRLLGLMHQATDAHAYVCKKVDMEALWDFFFETGFIYPEKYEFIQANKEKIKATYEKLYNQNPSVASHFIYQKDGRILAHTATVRFYESSWMQHHHAAIRSAGNRGGLIVLNQSGRFINESHRLYSMHMDYVFCYFRPDNKFPYHVFGGAARNIRDPKICSLDPFAYFHYRKQPGAHTALPSRWQLTPVKEEDLKDLQTFYENHSGGLMLQTLHLSPERFDCSGVVETYHRIGLKRERHLLALRYRDKLSAIIMANVTDLGLNMSELTNSISILVINGRYLTQDIIQAIVDELSHHYESSEIPILLYPLQTAEQIGIDMEKNYTLWAYDTRNLDPYFRFLKRLLKYIQH